MEVQEERAIGDQGDDLKASSSTRGPEQALTIVDAQGLLVRCIVHLQKFLTMQAVRPGRSKTQAAWPRVSLVTDVFQQESGSLASCFTGSLASCFTRTVTDVFHRQLGLAFHS